MQLISTCFNLPPAQTNPIVFNNRSFLSVTRNLAAGFLALLLCASCSSAPKELRLSANSAILAGDLGEYVEVVPGTYTVSESHENIMVLETHVKFRVKKALPAGKDVKSLSLDVFTADAMPVPGLDKFTLEGWFDSRLDPLRAALKTGTGEVVLPLYMDGNRDAALEAVEAHEADARKFAVTGALSDMESASASVSTETENPSNSEDCDQYLAHFDALMTSYAHMANKLSKNPLDLSILAEYADLTTKLQEMGQDKPAACEGNQAFAKHYARIMAKMSQAAAAQTTGTAKQQASTMGAMLESMSK